MDRRPMDRHPMDRRPIEQPERCAVYPRGTMSNDEQQDADRAFAILVVQRLRAAGYEALWAGGCVRDLLLGNAPTDYDVATSATPSQVRELFGNRKTIAVGAAFGVIIVLPERGKAQQIEVATFRTDATYSDGRRPDSVTFCTAEKDAHRRDFTINGMFFDPIAGEVLDFVGGEADLKRGLIRAIRFAARFNFALEAKTKAAVTQHAGEIQVVSGERIAMEVAKTLQTKRVRWAVESWAETGLMQYILPELNAQWPAEREASLSLLEAVCHLEGIGIDWRLRLATLLYRNDRQREATFSIINSLRQRLKLANEDSGAIEFVLSSQASLEAAETKPWSHVQPYLIRAHADLAIGLLAARNALGRASDATAAWLKTRRAWPADLLNPPPLIVGTDLIELGLKPGPAFSDLLGRARIMQLDEQLCDRPAAIAWLKSVT